MDLTSIPEVALFQINLKVFLQRLFSQLTVCPWNVLTGLDSPRRQTWMHWSVEHDAKVLLLCQSTSSAGAGKNILIIRKTIYTLTLSVTLSNVRKNMTILK